MLSKKQIEAGASVFERILDDRNAGRGGLVTEMAVTRIYQAMRDARSDRRKIIEATHGFEALSKIHNVARRMRA